MYVSPSIDLSLPLVCSAKVTKAKVVKVESSTFAEYLVTVSICGRRIEAWRRYSDFRRAYDEISPYSATMPPFPKKVLISNLKPQVIRQRISALNTWLHSVMMVPHLSRNPYIQLLVGISTHPSSLNTTEEIMINNFHGPADGPGILSVLGQGSLGFSIRVAPSIEGLVEGSEASKHIGKDSHTLKALLTEGSYWMIECSRLFTLESLRWVPLKSQSHRCCPSIATPKAIDAKISGGEEETIVEEVTVEEEKLPTYNDVAASEVQPSAPASNASATAETAMPVTPPAPVETEKTNEVLPSAPPLE